MSAFFQPLITIRPALPADAPGLARTHVASWRTTYRGLISDEFLQNLSVERRTQAWVGMLTNPHLSTFCLVAEAENREIVGFVSGGEERGHDPGYTGEVAAIYLVEQAQGRGTGRKLMQAAAGELIRRGHCSMLLWVLRENSLARKFYEALGGKFLRAKNIEIGGHWLVEVAYGWSDLRTLAGEQEEECPLNSKT